MISSARTTLAVAFVAAALASPAFAQSAADRLADLRATTRREPGRTDLYLQEAELLVALGRHEEAVVAAHAAAAAYPRDAVVQQQVGDLWRTLGRDDDAFDSYRRAVELAPDDPAPARRLAAALFGTGRTREAIAALAAAAKRCGPAERPKLLLAAARLCESAGDDANAAKGYAAVVRTGGDTTDVRLRLAETLYREGDWPAARGQFAKVYAATPEAFAGPRLTRYVVATYRSGDAVAALTLLDERAPTGPDAKTEILRALCAAKAGRSERARGIVAEIAARWPGHEKLPALTAAVGTPPRRAESGIRLASAEVPAEPRRLPAATVETSVPLPIDPAGGGKSRGGTLRRPTSAEPARF